MLAGAKLEEERNTRYVVLVEVNKLVASWWFRIHLGWGEMGELNVEEQRITWRKFREVGSTSNSGHSGGIECGTVFRREVGRYLSVVSAMLHHTSGYDDKHSK